MNEAWLRLVRQEHTSFENRKRFFGLAAQMMRQILVDYARVACADKRGGGDARITLKESVAAGSGDLEEFLQVDQALERLAQFSPRQAQVIEMRQTQCEQAAWQPAAGLSHSTVPTGNRTFARPANAHRYPHLHG